MAWTNLSTTEFYKKFIRQNEQLFSEDTLDDVQIDHRQSSLQEYAKLEA